MLNSQEKKQVYTKENLRIIKADSSIHYGKLVLYDDLSSEWIESSKIKTLLSKDSLRNVLREKNKININSTEANIPNWLRESTVDHLGEKTLSMISKQIVKR